jgi:methyl-accepting chemotaxis protein
MKVQISKSMEAINNVTNETSLGIQQMAKAAEDLNRLTDNLQNLISDFKISNSKESGYSVRQNGVLIKE